MSIQIAILVLIFIIKFMKLQAKHIDIIKAFLKDKPVLKAYLFGSYVRGDADEQSDIDILVELDYSKHIGLGFIKIKQELEQKLNKKIDLVSSMAVSKYILPFIDKEKLLIYEK